MSFEFVGKFIGADEIESTEVLDRTTPQGAALVKFNFKGGQSVVYSEKTVPYVVSDVATDASAVQERHVMPLVRECMALITEYDITYRDVDSFLKQLFSNINFQFDRAENFLWTTDDTRYVPGFDPRHDIRLLDAHKVLESIKTDGESK